MTTDPNPKPRGWGAVRQASQALAEQDRAVRNDRDRTRTEPGSIDAALIKPRQTNTRELDPYHVVDLAESIAALDLLEPLVIDRKNRLLAGGHRLAAVQLLAEPDPAKRSRAWAAIANLAWANDEAAALPKAARAAIDRLAALPARPSLVPVRIIDIDSESDGDAAKAFAIEVAENEKRRDYTKAEVVVLSERLKGAGYRMARGKPKNGERALGPALAVIIGKSERQVRRILGGDDIRTDVLISPKPVSVLLGRLQAAIKAIQDVSGAEKSRLAAVLDAAEKLSAAIAAIEDQG